MHALWSAASKHTVKDNSMLFAGVLCAHLFLLWVGNQLYFDPQGVATFWPASGLLIAFFILTGTHRWPVIAAAALLSGVVSDVLVIGRSFPSFVFYAGAGLFECVLGAWLLRKLRVHPFDILNLRHVLQLIFVAGFAATVLGALLGTIGAILAGIDLPPFLVWRTLWFADVLGVIVVAPLLLAAANCFYQGIPPILRSQIVELLTLLMLLMLVVHFVFGALPSDTHLLVGFPYLAFPLTIWAATRFRPLISAIVTLLLSFGALWQTDLGLGPFINQSLDTHSQALSVQGFVTVLCVFSPLLSATVQTAVANESLFKSFLENTPNLLTIKDLQGRYTHVSKEFCRVFNLDEHAVIGSKPSDVLPAPLAGQIETADQSSIGVSEVRHYEATVDTPDGQRTYMRVRFPVTDANGVHKAIGGIATDITAIRKHQRSLEASEERHRITLEAAGSGGWDFDVESQMLTVSESFLELMGYRRGEVDTTARLAEENIHPEDLPRVRQAFVDHVKGVTKFYQCELRIRHKSGRYIWFLVRGSAVERSLDGRVTRIVGANFDIDDRKHAEQALEKSESRYRQLFEAAPVALFESDWSKGLVLIRQLQDQGVTDVNGHLQSHPELIPQRRDMCELIDVNQEALRIYHADNKTELIDWIQSTKIDAMPAGLIERIAQHASGKRRTTLESMSSRVGGEAFEVLVTSENIGGEPGDWSCMLTSELDISVVKAAELQLRESEARFRNLAEGSLQGIAVFDADWELQFVNQSLAELLGYKDVQALLDLGNWAHCIPAQELARMREFQQRRLRGESVPNQYETELLRADGGVVHTLTGVRLIEWNKSVAFQYVVFDLTEKKRAEEKLLSYQEELRELAGKISLAEESERRRIASELHDGTVQNLVLARMNLSRLQKNLGDDESKVMAEDINELLEQSLSETRSMIFELSPPVLYELGLAAAVEWLCEQFKQRTGIIVKVISDDSSVVISHELTVVVFQAVREMLINVTKHAQASAVTLHWKTDHGSLNIIIEDNGVGFDVTTLGRRRASEGGFGLFSVRERLGLLGAQLTIESTSSGTRVCLHAPLET